MKWRDIRAEVVHVVVAAGRNVVVRILVGLLAVLGAADQVSDAPVGRTPPAVTEPSGLK